MKRPSHKLENYRVFFLFILEVKKEIESKWENTRLFIIDEAL